MKRAVALLVVGLGASACATASNRAPAGEARDRTDDPELAAARAAAKPDFETQADALAAGVYEAFVHPDSVVAAAPVPPGARVEPGADPTTAELLGTLTEDGPYNADVVEPGITSTEPVTLDRAPPAPVGGAWTLQLGAFESENGAFVRIRQMASEFPDLPRWYAREGGRVRVYVGRFADRTEAERQRARVAAAGYPDAWVTRAP